MSKGRTAMIGLEDLSIGYSRDSPLLESLSLELHTGTVLALVGRNGSGKSTLIRTILGLQAPLGGEVNLDGRSLSDYSPLQRSRLVSYVASVGGAPAGMTVRELVSLGRLPHTGWIGRLGRNDRLKVEEAIVRVGLEQFMHRKADRLSDGERQRVMLARALAQDTPLMVLDEPAAHLDIPNRAELMQILSGLGGRGRTILFSTHDLETAMDISDRFWVIHQGEICDGAPGDLGLSGLFDRLFDAYGMSFNADSGRFAHREAAIGEIILKGCKGAVKAWTERTLKRAGYSILEKYGSGHGREQVPVLEILKGDDGWAWRLEESGKASTSESLEELSRVLGKLRPR